MVKATSKEIRGLIDRATAIGWEVTAYNRGHFRILWPETGKVLTLPSTPSDRRAVQNAESDLARVSGPLTPRPGPGRSKQDKLSQRKRLADLATATRDKQLRKLRQMNSVPAFDTTPLTVALGMRTA